MVDKTPIECVCAFYGKKPFKSAFSDKIVHCYECDAYNDGIEKGRQMERERMIKSLKLLNKKGFTITEALWAIADGIQEQALKGGKDV